MKLIFKKDEKADISVHQLVGSKSKAFSYVDMIKYLLQSNKLADPELTGEFSDAEKASIKSMVTFINKVSAPEVKKK